MRRLLRHINGTDQPTLNVYGNCGEAFRTSPGVYSCPRDFDHIMSCLEGVPSDRLEIAAILRAEGFDLQDAAPLLGQRGASNSIMSPSVFGVWLWRL